MIDLQLKNRTAIVTGASRGLGKAISLALAEQSANVLAVARSEKELQELAARAPERIAIATCDLSDLDAVANLSDIAVERFGGIDVVVNNAGIAPAAKFLDQEQSEWDRVMKINVAAPAVLARAAGQHMARNGGGKIINIASTSGLLGKASLVAYSSSKGAVLQFTKALAAEWAKLNIQVNAIAPGAFETDAQRAVLDSPDILKRRLGKIPARRMGDIDEIGPLVCYLSSPLADFVTGSVFVIDGGESCKL